MIFSRTYRYQSAMPEGDIKSRLIGNHVKIHKLDFEVSEKDRMLRVIPHAEQVNGIKTLPITHVEFGNNGTNTQVTIKAKMRRLDSGGPTLIVTFCAFMLIGAVMFYLFGGNNYLSFAYMLAGISIVIFLVFWMRMETGYFDYVRKIRDHIKKETATA